VGRSGRCVICVTCVMQRHFASCRTTLHCQVPLDGDGAQAGAGSPSVYLRHAVAMSTRLRHRGRARPSFFAITEGREAFGLTPESLHPNRVQ
jgi:hypothetical protein